MVRRHKSLVHFDIAVNETDENQRGKESHCAQGQKESVTRYENGREEFDSLHKSCHIGPIEEVEDGINENEKGGGSG